MYRYGMHRHGLVALALMAATIAPALARSYDPVQFDDVDAGLPYDPAPIPVQDPTSLAGTRIAVVAAHGFEEIELTFPLEYLEARGATVDVLTPDWIQGRVMAVKFLKPSVWIPVTGPVSQADPAAYQAVLVPGGAWNPIIMRTDESVLGFLRKAAARGTLIASLCHGPQVLLSAGLVKGRTVTGVGDIRQDLRNAGATVVEDQPVVLDSNVLTSRDPNDVGPFSQAIEAWLRGQGRRQARFARLHQHQHPQAPGDGSWTTLCPHCKGSGQLRGGPGGYPYTCTTCKGSGKVRTRKPPVSSDH